MKIGFKFFPNRFYLIPKFKKYADFIEIMVPPNLDLSEIKNWGIPLTIHAGHCEFGFNPGDKKCWENNLRILDKAMLAARKVHSPYVVVHVGFPVNDQSEEVALEFFKKNYHPLMVLENCSVIGEIGGVARPYLYNEPKGMKKLLDACLGKMLLDFSHAICTANFLKKDPILMIEQFFKLQPACFHASGTTLNSVLDMHNHLSPTGNYPYFKNILKNQYVTLESGEPKENNLSEFLEDIRILREINKS